MTLGLRIFVREPEEEPYKEFVTGFRIGFPWEAHNTAKYVLCMTSTRKYIDGKVVSSVREYSAAKSREEEI